MNFLKPLDGNSKIGTTGIAAIKKELLPEHRIPLSKQKDNNIKGSS